MTWKQVGVDHKRQVGLTMRCHGVKFTMKTKSRGLRRHFEDYETTLGVQEATL